MIDHHIFLASIKVYSDICSSECIWKPCCLNSSLNVCWPISKNPCTNPNAVSITCFSVSEKSIYTNSKHNNPLCMVVPIAVENAQAD